MSMLAVHLTHHISSGDSEEGKRECQTKHLTEHINWSKDFASTVVSMGKKAQYFIEEEGFLSLTEKGMALAQEAIEG